MTVIGSLCTGYSGLDSAVEAVFGGSVAWASDVDAGACAVLKHRTPGLPNLGDITAIDWQTAAGVDLMCGGIPCQPFSAAGKRKGTADDRHLWPHMAAGIAVQRPELVVIENVQGLVTRGLSVVLADLAGMGYDAAWTVIGASDAGAPHRRRRLFILAVRDGLGQPPGFPVAVLNSGGWVAPGAGLFGPVPFTGRIPDHGVMAAGHIHGRPAPVIGAAAFLLPTPAACESGNTPENHLRKKPGRSTVTSLKAITEHGLLATGGRVPAETLRTPTAQMAVNGGSQPPAKRKAGGHGPTLADEIEHEIPGGGCRQPTTVAPAPRLALLTATAEAWGKYAPGVARWEAVLGREAPSPTQPGRDGKPRLSPHAVEWLMGLPAGWVCDVPGLSRSQQLKLLGNGVVPVQGVLALTLLAALLPARLQARNAGAA